MEDRFYIWRELDQATDRLVTKVFGGSIGARGVVAGICGTLLLYTSLKQFIVTLLCGTAVFLCGVAVGQERFRSGMRAARAYWLGIGLVRIVFLVTVSPILYFTGGLDLWLTMCGEAIPAHLGLAVIFYLLPPAPRTADEDAAGAEMKAESPRTEYERLTREAAEIERRKRELEDHPDINRL